MKTKDLAAYEDTLISKDEKIQLLEKETAELNQRFTNQQREIERLTGEVMP